jgi:SagB-type dehydrogenase family enzyme
MPSQNGIKTDLEPIQLPETQKTGGMTLLEALQLRRTERGISTKEIPLQVLSNLLWSAFGVNRVKSSFNKPGRTAPSASNSQEIDLYLLLKDGVYLYEATKHSLKPVKAGNFKVISGRGSSAQRTSIAPLNIIYVADLSRYDLGPDQPDPYIGDPEVQKSYYYTDTGFIAQNVYLYAASEGLASWFHNCDKNIIKKELYLHDYQIVLFAHTIGYPEKGDTN